MARTTPRPTPTTTQTLQSIVRHGACCGDTMWAAYHHYRTITTLEAVLRLTLQMRRCLNPARPQVRKPYRPEAAGRLALPKHAFGLDVIAVVGPQRYRHHRSVPELPHALVDRGMAVAHRSVTTLLERYAALLPLSRQDSARLQRLTPLHGRVLLALDGLQPDVGHAVLWVLRDCLPGEVLLAKSLLSSTRDDLATLIKQGKQALRVPMGSASSDGQASIRDAVAHAFPGVPPPLGHCHDLREAAKPIDEADRHAKTALQKRVRGVRPIARPVEGQSAPEAAVIRGDCRAVRSALTDDGCPPLDASGRTLHPRLSAMDHSLERGENRGPCLSH